MENGSLDELLTSVNVMMVSMSSMNRTFRIGFLHNCMVLTVHFGERCVHSLPIDTISFKVLIQLDHWELLLQRRVALSLDNQALMGISMTLIASLMTILRTNFDHLSVICTVLFRVSLMSSWCFSESHRSIIPLIVGRASIVVSILPLMLWMVMFPLLHIGVAVIINHLISIHKYQMSSMLLDRFGKVLLFLS